MTTELFKPQNKILQKYIEWIYILKHSKTEAKTSFISFPSVFPMVVTTLNAESIIQPNEITVKNSKTNQLLSEIDFVQEPSWVNYVGEIKEVAIQFIPLGLNRFINEKFSTYCKHTFSSFIPFEDFEDSMVKIISISNNKKMISALEKYWLKKLNDFQHPKLQAIINSINSNPKQTLSSLAKENGLTHKTLITHFKNHIGRSPSDYKKVVRFRNALNEKLKNQQKKLTEICYLAEYYDQAHMITGFKKMTGLPPKTFFKNLTSLEKNKLNWMFLNK